LHLRRVIEGDKLGLNVDIQEARDRSNIEKAAREKAENETRVFRENIRSKRRGELMDEYDNQLRNNRVLFFTIPTIFTIGIYVLFIYLMPLNTISSVFAVGCAVEFLFGLIPIWPINSKLVSKYSERVTQIEAKIELEILEMKKQAEALNN